MLLLPTLLTLLSVSGPASPAAAPTSPAVQGQAPARLVRIELGQRPGLDVAALLRADFDVIYVEEVSGRVELIAADDELARLRQLGIPFEVVHEDLVAFYAARLAQAPPRAAPRLGSWLNPPFGQGAMGGYYTFVQIGQVLDQIAAAYPSLVTPKASLGTTIEGRSLWRVKLSDNPLVDEAEPEVRFDALHHAREPESMQVILWMLLSLVEGYGTDPLATWIVDNREIWFVPCVNPDGYVYNQQIAPGGGGLWRKNRRNNGGGSFGVDLNRNYPFQWGVDNVGSSPTPDSETYRGSGPASEPEVAAMVAFIAARSFGTAVSCHTFSDLWLAPWGYTTNLPAANARLDEIGALATQFNGYPYGPASLLLYLANGTTLDQDLGVRNTYGWSPEIGDSNDGFWPVQARIEPLAEGNRLALWRTALAAGAYVHVESLTLTEVGDGDGHYEPGESIEARFHVRNSGRAATATPVALALTSASPYATITAGAVSLGTVGSFASANNDATPLVLMLSPATPTGVTVAFDASVSWEGYTETSASVVPVGEPRPFLTDDLETELGWLAGLPGDTATTGEWEYGNPVGTSNGGSPSNPEDDATPGAGVRCYATGNGSTTAGGDDVDNGFTTLVSPAMHLAGVASARLTYRRWFVDFTTADDALEVSLSDDDGQSWVPLETFTQPTGVWSETSIDVGSHVSLTDEVRLRFVASDDPNNSVTEAGVDELKVEIYESAPRLNLYGRPTVGDPVAFHVTGEPAAPYAVYWSTGTANVQLPFLVGPLLLDPSSLTQFLSGSLGSNGLARRVVSSPNDPGLVGLTFYFQTLVVSGGAFRLSNRDQLTFE